MNPFPICALAIVCFACLVASVPLHDLATFKAAGLNVTRNLEGKKETMVCSTTASSQFQVLKLYSNLLRLSMPTPLGIVMENIPLALAASKYVISLTIVPPYCIMRSFPP